MQGDLISENDRLYFRSTQVLFHTAVLTTQLPDISCLSFNYRSFKLSACKSVKFLHL